MSAFSVRRSTFKVFVVVFLWVFQTLLAVCPPGWLAWQHSCYILLPDRMNWFQASKLCDQPGSSLVVPDSQEEHDFIWREMKLWASKLGRNPANNFELWLGCQDLYNSKRTLMCSGKEVFPEFTNWADDEPNYEPHVCVRMTDIYDGKWGDTSCNGAKFVACEIRVSRRVYCLPSDADGRVTPQCLLNHHIKNLTTTGVTGCGLGCWVEPRCHSFNLWQQAGQAKICQLNKAPHSDADVTDFKQVDNCSFFKLCTT